MSRDRDFVLRAEVTYRMRVRGPEIGPREYMDLHFDENGLWCRRTRSGYREEGSFTEVLASQRSWFPEKKGGFECRAIELLRSGDLVDPRSVWALFWDMFVVPAYEGRDGGWLTETFPAEARGWILSEAENRRKSALGVLES